MICTRCGAPVSEDDVRCRSCDQALSSSETVPATPSRTARRKERSEITEQLGLEDILVDTGMSAADDEEILRRRDESQEITPMFGTPLPARRTGNTPVLKRAASVAAALDDEAPTRSKAHPVAATEEEAEEEPEPPESWLVPPSARSPAEVPTGPAALKVPEARTTPMPGASEALKAEAKKTLLLGTIPELKAERKKRPGYGASLLAPKAEAKRTPVPGTVPAAPVAEAKPTPVPATTLAAPPLAEGDAVAAGPAAATPVARHAATLAGPAPIPIQPAASAPPWAVQSAPAIPPPPAAALPRDDRPLGSAAAEPSPSGSAPVAGEEVPSPAAPPRSVDDEARLRLASGTRTLAVHPRPYVAPPEPFGARVVGRGTPTTRRGGGVGFPALVLVGLGLGIAAATLGSVYYVQQQDVRDAEARRVRSLRRLEERRRVLQAEVAAAPRGGVVADTGCSRSMRLVGGPAPFCIDIYEYPGARALPRVGITWREAKGVCAGRRARLCTAAEWERACRGPQGAVYPYGARFEAGRCNVAVESGSPGELVEGGAFAACHSAVGIYDMSGNAAEWVEEKAWRGGSVAGGETETRCTAQVASTADGSNPRVGFRCCAAPVPAGAPASGPAAAAPASRPVPR